MKPCPIVLSALLALAGAGTAQVAVEAAATGPAKVRSLHEAFVKVREEANKEMQPLMAEWRAAERGSEEQRRLSARLNEIRGRTAGPQRAFQEAFAASDWTKFDPREDDALLREGLPVVARDLSGAPERAIKAARYFLQHFGDDRQAGDIRGRVLPNALLATGQSDEVGKLLKEVADEAGGAAKARALLALGDFQAAKGDAAAAAKLYDQAEELADENTMRNVTLRKALVGKQAPDITGEHWIGAEPSSLTELRGKVVLVDFWATWCGPCRHVMPALNEMYHEFRDQGLEILGLTRYYANGYLPANKEQMMSGGESVRGMDEDSFLDHVADFKRNTGIDYPFVVGTAANFSDYNVTGIPTLAVVDREGKVALVVVGSGSEPMLRFAVTKLLAKK